MTIARSNMTLSLSVELHAGGGDESVSVRILRRSDARVPLHPAASSSATWARSAVRCSTASICTSRCRRCRTRSCAGESRRRARPRSAAAWSGARAVQQARGYYNSHIPAREIRKLCALDDAGERTLEMAVRRMGLSARAHDRILKVARTIADLDGLGGVSAKHLAEAVQYRSLDRNYWT